MWHLFFQLSTATLNQFGEHRQNEKYSRFVMWNNQKSKQDLKAHRRRTSWLWKYDSRAFVAWVNGTQLIVFTVMKYLSQLHFSLFKLIFPLYWNKWKPVADRENSFINLKNLGGKKKKWVLKPRNLCTCETFIDWVILMNNPIKCFHLES